MHTRPRTHACCFGPITFSFEIFGHYNTYVWLVHSRYPRPPLSFPTPGKTVPRHPLGDGHQVTVPHHPLGDRSTAVHAHCGAQKLRQKTK